MSDSSLEIIDATEVEPEYSINSNPYTSLSDESLGASLSTSLNRFYSADDDDEDEKHEKEDDHDYDTLTVPSNASPDEGDYVEIKTHTIPKPKVPSVSEVQFESSLLSLISENTEVTVPYHIHENDSKFNAKAEEVPTVCETLPKEIPIATVELNKHPAPEISPLNICGTSQMILDENLPPEWKAAGDTEAPIPNIEPPSEEQMENTGKTFSRKDSCVHDSYDFEAENDLFLIDIDNDLFLGNDNKGPTKLVSSSPEFLYENLDVKSESGAGSSYSFTGSLSESRIASRTMGVHDYEDNESFSSMEGFNDISKINNRRFGNNHLQLSEDIVTEIKRCLRRRNVEIDEGLYHDDRNKCPACSTPAVRRAERNHKIQNGSDCSFKEFLAKKSTSSVRLRTTKISHGFLYWLQNVTFLQRFARHARNTLNTIIATLDPEMSEYIGTEADLSLFVVTMNPRVTAAIKSAFQSVFPSMLNLDIRSLPAMVNFLPNECLGFQSGLLSAEAKVEYVRKRHLVPQKGIVLTAAPILVEITPMRWHSCACILLDDPNTKLSLHVYTQTTPVPNDYVDQAKLRTPDDYNLKSMGLSMTVGDVMALLTGISNQDWQKTMTDVSCYSALENAAKTMAGMYKRYLDGWNNTRGS